MMSATPETTTGNTLYDQIGGAAAVDAAVDIFYRKVLTDYRINRFFDDIDMEGQVAKQKAFFTISVEKAAGLSNATRFENIIIILILT
jgi:hemoglobin